MRQRPRHQVVLRLVALGETVLRFRDAQSLPKVVRLIACTKAMRHRASDLHETTSIRQGENTSGHEVVVEKSHDLDLSSRHLDPHQGHRLLPRLVTLVETVNRLRGEQ